MKTLRFFISSPGDVFEERALAGRVIERLQSEFIGKVVLEPVLWEHEPLLATATFQTQIVQPSDTDVVVAILWSRLGTPLPSQFRRADGSRYESGTEYEFEEAIAGFRKNGKPNLLVYRRSTPPSVRLDDEKDLLERLAQKKKLDEFVGKWFHDQAEGTLVAAFHPFESPSDFEMLLETHLHRLIERALPRSMRSTSEARAVWKKGSPFRGLAAFEFEHAPVFFGRTRAVSDVLHALREQAIDWTLVRFDSRHERRRQIIGGARRSLADADEAGRHRRRRFLAPRRVQADRRSRRHLHRPREGAASRRRAALTGWGQRRTGRACAGDAAITAGGDSDGAQRSGAQRRASEKANGRLALVIDQMEELFTQEDILHEHREAFVNVSMRSPAADESGSSARCAAISIRGSRFCQSSRHSRKVPASTICWCRPRARSVR